ncbi:MAG: FAD-dependent oxidoreductase [Candidatus Aminicenantia bacterium]
MKLTINDIEIEAIEGTTVLEAAISADIYIPHLCAHSDIPSFEKVESMNSIFRGKENIETTNPERKFEGCQLCVMEIQGIEDFPLACITEVKEGMVIQTDTERLQKIRQDNLVSILANHPHICLTCAQREGCSLTQCSMNVPENERCCLKFDRCEVRKVADYIGIKEDIIRYVPQNLPVIKDEPLFVRDYNLCIGCTRCVRICENVRGVGALGIVYQNEKVIVGTIGPSLKESGCKFCGACVEICPTGALMDADIKTMEESAFVPCKYACPAGIDVPRYIHLIADEKFSQAATVIREKVPFPSILGYICHHPCEEECRRGQLNEPIAICALKRFVIEKQEAGSKKQEQENIERGFIPVRRSGKQEERSKRVAIVGSGPAGLTSAYYLANLGHSVTVFESQPEPGGMLRYGIPDYRLPKHILKNEINEILDQNIKLKTNYPIRNINDLKNQGWDAIYLAYGAQLSKKLDIEGVKFEGVLWGLDFLRDINLKKKIEVKEKVTIIGGGNVALDVALTILRLGSKEVQIACLESREEMPAFEWEIQEVLEEDIILNTSWGPKRIVGDGSNVKGVELVRCTSVFDEQGNFRPEYDPSIIKYIDSDMVILAIGQEVDLSLLENSSIKLTEKGTVQVNENLETSVPGVFAGGDVVSGPSSVIEAIALGRKAAISIDKYLGGNGVIYKELVELKELSPWLGKEESFADKSRVKMPTFLLKKRKKSFDLIELGFDEQMAIQEAKRCLRCDLRLQVSSPFFPPERWLEFNSQNISSVPETGGVYQLLDAQKNIIYIAGAPNLRRALQEQLSSYKEVRFFDYEEDLMYTKRESELLQQYLQKHGRLPEGNEELEDLF